MGIRICFSNHDTEVEIKRYRKPVMIRRSTAQAGYVDFYKQDMRLFALPLTKPPIGYLCIMAFCIKLMGSCDQITRRIVTNVRTLADEN